MERKILDFRNTDNEIDSFRFIVVEANLDKERVFNLSPKVMQWEEGLWVFDFNPVRNYWNMLLIKNKMGFSEFLSSTILTMESSCSEKSDEPPEKNHRAVLVDHPFLGVLFIKKMKERGLFGSIYSKGAFGEALFKSMDLSLFFEASYSLAFFWEIKKQKDFKASAFRSQMQKFEKFLKGTSFEYLYKLDKFNELSLKRRYGKWVSLLWSWVFLKKNDDKKSYFDGFLQEDFDFPWVKFEVSEKPTINHYLEYPVEDWQVLKRFLEEDFTKLCQEKGFDESKKAVLIKWVIVFYHLEAITVDICFRHPHSLHEEIPTQETALLQAQFGFEDAMKKIRCRDDFLDLPNSIPVVSWVLTLEDYFVTTKEHQKLWDDVEDKNQKTIFQLENKLFVPLKNYRIRQDFFPEESFCTLEDYSISLKEASFTSDCWMVSAKSRPFFIYKNPEKITSIFNEKMKKKLLFLERTHVKWWRSNLSEASYRDYYLWLDEKRKLKWIYKDSLNHWYLHGIYS